ncbi:MAG: isochorismatase family cysteine hydrolase [Rhodospirillales bacterium]
MTGLLMIIDVQRGFINEHTRAIPAGIEALQNGYKSVIATRFINPEGSMHRRLMGWKRFAPGSGDVELAFTPRHDARVIDKTAYTAASAELLDELRRGGIEEVHLCGIATDNCVLKTAVDLFEAGIKPVVLADHCASHGGPECHACGIRLLKRFIGEKQVRGG